MRFPFVPRFVHSQQSNLTCDARGRRPLSAALPRDRGSPPIYLFVHLPTHLVHCYNLC